MKVTMLGCGTSVGVPALGHAGWGGCDPNDPRNRRQRCAVLVEINDKVILVDAGPDIRNQLLPLGLKRIDALLITHTHSDHVAGLDDLRAFYWPDRIDIPVYATKQHSIDILARFPYLFTKHAESPSYFVPPMKMNLIAANDILEIGGCKIEIFHQDHGNTSSLGFLFDEKSRSYIRQSQEYHLQQSNSFSSAAQNKMAIPHVWRINRENAPECRCYAVW